ncbi:hypothetical protein MASR2M41_18500 [Flammeovirgaceae bacterium]
MKYTAKNFEYTDPRAYDERVKQPTESLIASLWDPILFKYLREEIQSDTVVADLGCGTFIHTQHMGKARHIYAVDINQKMLDFGRYKISAFENKVTVLCESGTKTSIPDESCDLVWIDGLSEFLNLDELFIEVRRILKPAGRFIILYQNKYHPENILVAIYYWLKKRSGKKYRSIFQFKKTAARHRLVLEEFQSTAFFCYLPEKIQAHFVWFWRCFNALYQPFQKYFPIGNNVICKFRKSLD